MEIAPYLLFVHPIGLVVLLPLLVLGFINVSWTAHMAFKDRDWLTFASANAALFMYLTPFME